MTTRVNRMTRGIIVEKLESADEGLWIFVDEGSFWVVKVVVVVVVVVVVGHLATQTSCPLQSLQHRQEMEGS